MTSSHLLNQCAHLPELRSCSSASSSCVIISSRCCITSSGGLAACHSIAFPQATCKHAWPALCSTTPTSATTGSKGTASSMGCGTSHMSSAYCSFLRSPSAKPANVVSFRAHHTLKPTTHRSATLLAVVATVAPWHEAEASRGHAARPHPTCCQVARTCPAKVQRRTRPTHKKLCCRTHCELFPLLCPISWIAQHQKATSNKSDAPAVTPVAYIL